MLFFEGLDNNVNVIYGVVDDVTANTPITQFGSDGDIGGRRVQATGGVIVNHDIPLAGYLHQSGNRGVVAARQRDDFMGHSSVVESGQKEDFIAAGLLDRLAHRLERRGVDQLLNLGHGGPGTV